MSEIDNSKFHEYQYIKDPTAITTFLMYMLWISLGISVISLLSDFMQMNLLTSVNIFQDELDNNNSRQQIIGIISMGVLIISGISFLKWSHRMNTNCHGFGAKSMEFTPGWSIGYYFIPLVNLYKPYKAMQEIWKISTNPTNWQNETTSTLVNWWWALNLINHFFGQAVLRASVHANTLSAFKDLTNSLIVLGFIEIVFYIITILLVSKVFTKQELLVKNKSNLL